LPSDMKVSRKVWVPLAALLVLYISGPVVVFDFSSTAVPFDEEYHNGKEVAIGPRPRAWVPFAAFEYDAPGGFDYAPDRWPFVVWKPLCLAYLLAHGYERPSEWRGK
jgi:hypothetical protein